MDDPPMRRLGLVVHPRRELTRALDAIARWGDAHGRDVVQIPTEGQTRRVADLGDPAECDLIVALGGDGTTLAAVRAASPVDKPVLGVACGSLGALTAVTADHLVDALDRVAAGDWFPRRLPAVRVDRDRRETLLGVNDVVVVREGAGQVSGAVALDGERFIRFAGDGAVVATPLGSSAYTLAVGGPLLAPRAQALVLTLLAPHGGSCPPLVTGADGVLTVDVDPGHGGARLEVDGQVRDRVEPLEPCTLTVSLHREHAVLVGLGGEEPLLTGLRRRRVLMDSPRVLARDEREAAEAR